MDNNTVPAATILLLRNAPRFEVLMIERHQNIDFAGGALVFPGGRIEEGDRDPAWAEHCDGFDEASLNERPARIAAIREAFEETGLLLARRASEDALVDDDFALAVAGWRAIVEKDDGAFLAFVKQEKLKLACNALCFFAHWRPPQRGQKRRYDTLFFAAPAPGNQNAREDGNEATEALWISPKEALAARAEGKRKMMFPTACNVQLLSASDNVEAVFRNAAQRKIEPIEPRVVERDGKRFLTIPDDLGYPVTEESIENISRG